MTKKPEPSKQESLHPDRPLECSDCKRPIVIHYTEIVGDCCTNTGMCSECPVYQRKIHGSTTGVRAEAHERGKTGLACGECGTTLEEVRVGTPLGCGLCYEVFGDVLQAELLKGGKIPQQQAKRKKGVPIHIGRSPGEKQEMNSSLKLLALNEALDETLKREDYEQAALLRDQIKELTKESE